MANQIKVGHLEPDSGVVNLPLGFIPDVFVMDELTTSAPDHIRWYRRQEQDEASASAQGIITNGADGVISRLGAGNGITAYNASSQRPQIGIWRATNSAILTRDGTSLTITARTVTAPGTYVNPTVGSATDRQALFECVAVSGNTASSEPTWPDSIGENVTDNAVTWKRVDASLQRGGYQGVIVATALNTNGQEWYYVATQADQVVDHGDTDGWTDGIDPDA